MPIPQGKPDANKTRWGLPENPSPTGFRCINLRIPDNDYYQSQVIGFLYRLAQQNRYDRDNEHTAKIVAATWQSAIAETLDKWLVSCDGDPVPPPTTEVITEIRRSIIYEEIEAEMSNLRIESIDGKPYLEEDCGCGERNYYGLTLATVNPQTGAISDSLDTPPSYVQDVPLTASQIDSCYSEKVADTVIDALTEYAGAVFDFALLGIGTFFPVTTSAIIGAVEIQQSVTAALNGDLTLDFSDVGYTANEVIAVFQSQAFRDFIKNRIGSDQRISRFALENVALRLLNNNSLNFPTPTYPVFVAWLRMANIAELNLQFQQRATECATGNTVPGTFPSVGDLLLSNEWALAFDLRIAPLEVNAFFAVHLDGSNPIGLWEQGVGYYQKPDIQEDPHASTRLYLDFIQGTGGDCTTVWCDYEYVPLLEGSISRLHEVFGTDYGKDTEFNGIRVTDTTGWTSGTRSIDLRPYRVLNSDFANGGTAILRQIALAGSGDNPFSGLVQDFS